MYGLYVLECVLYVWNDETKYHNSNTRNKNEKFPSKHNLKGLTKNTSYAGVNFLKYLPKKVKEDNIF